MTVAKIESHFPVPYQDYLDQDVIWPRLPDDQHTWDDQFHREGVQIADMPPQHGASALAKLVRWAVHAPAGHLVTVMDVTAREEYVRTSPLGAALAARALNLDVASAHAIAQGRPAVVNHLVAHVIAELIQRTPLAAEPAMDLALSIVTRLTDHWTIVEKP